MTSTQIIHAVAYEIETQLNLIDDTDNTEQKPHPGSEAGDTENATTTTPPTAKIPRIQFLRLSSTADTARGIPGITPPYCPAAPTLFREVLDGSNENILPQAVRNKSPLRNLVLTNYALRYSHSRARSDFDDLASHLSTDQSRYYSMPHAVSAPHAGFQALILCGPGIGISTFTSVPSEYPKALVNVANRPMVWYVLDWCYRMGVTNITLITPPAAKDALRAALDQNPYLTSLPSPSPDLLAPKDLEFTTPTAELLRMKEVQKVITSDFLLLPCDLICDIAGDGFLETYLTSLGGLAGLGSASGSSYDATAPRNFTMGGEGSGRRGGLSIWYNTADREESVKGEECDYMVTAKLDDEYGTPVPQHPDAPQGMLRTLVMTMPMSEVWDEVQRNKVFRLRQSMMRKYGAVKMMTKYRDSHIYVFPYWVKEFAKINDDFESISEDLVGSWAKAQWRKPTYRAKFGVSKLFSQKKKGNERPGERPIEEEIDLLSLSSTHLTRHIPAVKEELSASVRLASRVNADADDAVLSPAAGSEDGSEAGSIPQIPPVLSFILPATADAPLLRRVDTTPLLLSVSLLLAKIPSMEECTGPGNKLGNISPFAHVAKIAGTVTVAQRVTISRADTLIDSNSMIATQCVIKTSVIGSSVSIGTGTRITGCVIMDGATIGDKCILTGTVIGKKAKIGNGCTLQGCEVQDGNMVAPRTEGKGEKYLVGGLEDDLSGDDYDEVNDDDDEDDGDDPES